MPSTYTESCHHIVFATKGRERVLIRQRREDLFRYIWGILKNHHCHLYRINGIEDHLHILTSLNPSVALADLVKDIKVASALWIKEGGVFPGFTHWQDGYGAFTVSHRDRGALIDYIKQQEEHHLKQDYLEELRELLSAHGMQLDEQHLP
jgi:REP element-mobilizing transposase RayT